MIIELKAPRVYETADKILNGELPPETNDIEVMEALFTLANLRNIKLTFFRIEKIKNQVGCVSFEHDEIKGVLRDNIEVRPTEPGVKYHKGTSRVTGYRGE